MVLMSIWSELLRTSTLSNGAKTSKNIFGKVLSFQKLKYDPILNEINVRENNIDEFMARPNN